MEVDLATARDALAHGDHASVLRTLLAVWQRVPDVALADAIEKVGVVAARAVPAIGGVGLEFAERDAAWHADVASGDPVVRHHAIATLCDLPDGDGREAIELSRVRLLVETNDPRVAKKLFAIVRDPKRSPTWHVATFWRPLYESILACGDPRARTAMADLPRHVHPRDSGWAALAKRLDKLDVRLAERYPDPQPVLAPAARAIVDAIVEALPRAHDAETGAALLAMVYAHPADDGPRLACADWLQQRGDPRGELMALQLGPEPRNAWARCRELVAQYGARWLGPIARSAQNPEFARGFLDRCTLYEREPCPTSVMWSTVTSVDGFIPATDEYPMPILRSATDLRPAAVIHLDALAAPPPLVEIGISMRSWTEARPVDAATVERAVGAFARVLPRLLELRVVRIFDPAWIDRAPSPSTMPWSWRATQIRQLKIVANLGAFAVWCAEVASSQLDSFEMSIPGENITFERGADGQLSRLSLRHKRRDLAQRVADLADALDRLPAGRIVELSLHMEPAGWTRAMRARIQPSLRRHPAIDLASEHLAPYRLA
jgi:uncharacterized protein (TIGR02996 family)